ncbi:MAG: hypothetical protein HMLKMBBP_03763 [Planctomycetes bacterium]|nr:hypothetical protein [Planctomycetota bacterium]
MVRFLHTADWQLGMTRRFFSSDAQARFTDDRFDAVANLLRAADEEGCAFVVVAGDVFETNQVGRATVARAMDVLRGARMPVFLLPGNHDPLDAGSVWRGSAFRERRPPHVTVLETTAPVAVAPGVEVVGAPWTSKRPLRDLAAAACAGLAPAAGTLRVVVAHGATDTLSPNPDDPARIVVADAERALREGRIHYMALGDRHSMTDAGGGGRIRYSGAPEATDFDETAPGFALVCDVDESRCDVRAVRTGRWTFRLAEWELAGAADVERAAADIAAVSEKPRTVLKATLRGTLTLAEKARLDTVLADAAESFGAFELWDRHTDLVVRADASDVSSLPSDGFARRAAERLREEVARGGAEGRVAADALGLLLRLARKADAS